MKNKISNEIRVEAIALVVVDGLKPKEVAEKLSVSESSVRRWTSNKELVEAVKADMKARRVAEKVEKEEAVVEKVEAVAEVKAEKPAEAKPYVHRNGKVSKAPKRRKGTKLSKVLEIVKKEVRVHGVEVNIELLGDKDSEVHKLEKEVAQYVIDKLYDGNALVGRRMVGIALDDIANGNDNY